MTRTRRTVIIGGGIAGPVAAIALRRAQRLGRRLPGYETSVARIR